MKPFKISHLENAGHTDYIIIPHPAGKRSIMMSVCVGLCVVRTHISRTTHPNLTKFLCMLPMAMAQSSSPGGVAIYYVPVPPVLLTTSCLQGGSVAEWPACWTQAKKGLGSNCSHHSVHQAAKLVTALFRAARVTAGLAENNGSLLPGLRLTSPAG